MELDISTQKRSTLGANNESWLRSVNNSELGDWKNDESIVVNSLSHNPIYDIKMKTAATIKSNEETELKLKEIDSIINSD